MVIDGEGKTGESRDGELWQRLDRRGEQSEEEGARGTEDQCGINIMAG